jgi:hypothetical protein
MDNLEKKKNWDDVALNFAIDVEGGSKIRTTRSMFGVLVTLVRNHLYGITQSCKRGKYRVLQKGEQESLVAKNLNI